MGPDGRCPDTAFQVVRYADAMRGELEAFQWQVSRWQKFLSREDFMLFLERIAKLVDEQLAALNDRFDEEVPA